MRKKYLLGCLAVLLFTFFTALSVYAEEAEQSEPETEFETEPETEQSDFDIRGTTLVAYYGTSAEVVIPTGVTKIGAACFYGNQTILRAVLPETVEVIGIDAFCDTSLKEVALPTGLKKIESGAFSYTALREVTLPDGLEVIETDAFYCDGLLRICIPRSVREIEIEAFAPWTHLDCYRGTAGFAYAKKYQPNNSMALDGEKNFSELQIALAQTDFACNGYAVWPEVTVYDGGILLKEGTDYIIQCDKNIQPGIYTATVQATLSEIYTGSRTFTYTIHPRTVRHLVSGLETSSDKVVLQWNKSLGADSYEISRYDSKAKKWILMKKLSETGYIDTGLKADTTYKYRVRSCAAADGQDIYGDYSSTLTVRTLPTDKSIKKANNSVKKGAAAAVASVNIDLGVSLDTFSLGWDNWSHVSDVTEFLDGKGNYCFAYKKGSYVYIKKYTSSLKLKQTLKIKQKYPLLGGVICDTDSNYYIVWGKKDEKGTGNVDTMAISKYDPKGKHVKTTKYYTEKNALKKNSWDTRYPFEAGNCAIAIKGNILVCSYGREMYNGHQSNEVISVDVTTMEKITRFTNYVSHSFNQSLLISKDNEAVFTNHGDAYPRGIETAKEWLTAPSELDWGAAEEESPITKNNSFHFYGETGNNWTGAQLGGIAEVSSGFFLAAAAPRSMTKKSENEKRDVFVQLLSKQDLKSVLKASSRSGTSAGVEETDKGILWLTNYSGKYTANAVSVTATDDDRVIVMWEKADASGFQDSYYMILSANGRILQKATSLSGRRLNLYEAPVYRKGYLYWTSAESGTQKVRTYRMKVNGVVVPKKLGTVEGLKFEKYRKSWSEPIALVLWENVSDAQGYEVYRAASQNGTYKKVQDVDSAGAIGWYDEKVSRNATYYYKVRAWRKVNGKRIVGKYSKVLKVKVDWP